MPRYIFLKFQQPASIAVSWLTFVSTTYLTIMKYTTLVLSIVALFLFGCSKQEAIAPITTDTGADSMKQAMKGLVEAINTNKLDDMDKYIANNMIEHASMTTRAGKLQTDWLKGIKGLVADEIKESPDNTYVIEEIVTDGNICVARTLQTRTRMTDSTGVEVPRKKYRVSTLWARWEHGKFVEVWSDGEMN
jgi:hypothetical protein